MLAIIAGFTVAGTFLIDHFRQRAARSSTGLVGLLPNGDATVFYAQVDVLRNAGLLTLLSASRAGQDADYQAFVKATNFDYSRDIDAIAGSASHGDLLLAIKGRFDWDRIRNYIVGRGGVCQSDHCSVAGSRPETWVGLVRLSGDVLGVSVGKSRLLADAIHTGQDAAQPLPSGDPVWVKLAPDAWHQTSSLPPALQIFAIGLEPAKSVVISLAPAPAGSPDAFEIQLAAECDSQIRADMIKSQLVIDTRMLTLELTHEHQRPNPADLTGLLTSGTFTTGGAVLKGQWPVSKELLKTLQQ